MLPFTARAGSATTSLGSKARVSSLLHGRSSPSQTLRPHCSLIISASPQRKSFQVPSSNKASFRCCAVAPASEEMSLETSDEEAPSCSPSFVTIDNKSNERFTKITVTSVDYPGLLRSLSWVLNGMGVRVQHATMGLEEGMARDTFWVTTFTGKKLDKDAAAMLRERIQEIVIYCEPHGSVPEEWECGQVKVSNKEHEQYTCLFMEGEPTRQGFLLDLMSVITGTGSLLVEGRIQGEPIPAPGAEPTGMDYNGLPAPVVTPSHDFSDGRFFKFYLTDRQGRKLDSLRVSTLLFTLSAFTGKGYMPLQPPSSEAFAK